MLGVRFFACEGCDTVYAGVEPPERCGDCGSVSIEEISDRLRADTYFNRAAEPR